MFLQDEDYDLKERINARREPHAESGVWFTAWLGGYPWTRPCSLTYFARTHFVIEIPPVVDVGLLPLSSSPEIL
jgi:hypothetical protein